jgi:hypothetical protein
MHQPGRMVHILPERPAPQAGSKLTGFFDVVTLYPENAVVLDMQPQRASAAAVESGSGPDNFDVFV